MCVSFRSASLTHASIAYAVVAIGFACSSIPRYEGANLGVAHTLALADTSRIDPLFAEWNRADSPGCAVAVIQDGKVVLAKGYGMANLEHHVPIGPKTVFDIGSTSKQFTAACVLLLERDRRLSLDDDVRRYVPELPKYGSEITLRHLLTHTSGLRDYLVLLGLSGSDSEDFTTKADALALVCRQKELNFAPGAEFLYSNTGYFLLSVIVERVAHMSLARFAAERIFEPLQMTSTHIHDDHGLVVNARACGYRQNGKGGFAIEMSDYEQVGDGAVMTTVEDLAKWDVNFYNGFVGGSEMLTRIHRPGLLNDGQRLDYAAGLFVTPYRGLECVSHGGSWAGYRAELMRFPSERFSVIILSNLAELRPTELAQRVAEVYLGPKLQPAVAKDAPSASASNEPQSEDVADEALTPFEGEYSSSELGSTWSVRENGRELELAVNGRAWRTLRHLGSRRFEEGGVEITFSAETEARASSLTVDAGRVRGLRFERLARP